MITTEAIAAIGWQLFWWIASAGVLAAIAFGIPWLRAKARAADVVAKATGHTTMWYWLEQACEKAVVAADQYLKDNPDKKEYAIKFVRAFLLSRGIVVPEEVISGAVEAAVAKMKAGAEPKDAAPSIPTATTTTNVDVTTLVPAV